MNKDLEYWLALSSKWESSGLAQAKFCEKNGVNYSNFVYWRGELIRKGLSRRFDHRDQDRPASIKTQDSLDFVSLSCAQSSKMSSGFTNNKSHAITLNLPFGITLSIPADVA